MTHPTLFDGDTFDAGLDGSRLGRQLTGVLAVMKSRDWYTLAQLVALVGGSEAGVSARLRDLRKPKFGGHRIARRRKGEPSRGVWEYRLEG